MHALIKRFGSLKLTVVLLALSMALVFFGTLDQMQLGIHEVQKRYFESFLVLFPQQMPRLGLPGFYFGGFLPLPGGYLVGGLLIINLLCAHYLHFKARWSKLGISLIHAGILALLVSGFVTSFVQKESHMAILEGERTNFSFSQMKNELVLTDTSNPDHNTEISIPTDMLKAGKEITHEALPFSIKVKKYHPNANLYPQPATNFFEQVPDAYAGEATRGVGARMNVAIRPIPVTYTTDGINTATAVVDVMAEDKSLGTWVVANVFDNNSLPSQSFEFDGKTWEIALRFKRTYNPYWIELIDVRHDVYPGTQIPKNYSSKINIFPFDDSPDRQALIYMNHPLRYEGLTYYQSGINNNGQGTVFQVVRNPGWLLPYIAILLVGLGMTWQFSYHLIRFLAKRNASKA